MVWPQEVGLGPVGPGGIGPPRAGNELRCCLGELKTTIKLMNS